MITNINGNNIRISIKANELTNRVHITLPDGYSYETIHFTVIENIGEIANLLSVGYDLYNFPPSTFDLFVQDLSKRAELRIVIEKFGQIPDDHYFEPILVTGDDGNKHNVIPSEQFK